MRARRVDIAIAALLALAVIVLLDHYRIHGYLYDKHDLLLQTESGKGYDSHEFFAMLPAVLATILGAFRALKKE